MKHLGPQQFIALLEGTPDLLSRGHLVRCASCREEVAALQAITATVAASAAVSEPSPLFWNHFTSRLQTAIAAEPATPVAWWRGVWRPIAGIGVALACVALVLMVRVTDVPQPVGAALTDMASDAGETVPADSLDPSGVFVAQLAANSSWDELQQIVPTSSDGEGAMMASLTPDERAAFVRLLKARTDGEE